MDLAGVAPAETLVPSTTDEVADILRDTTGTLMAVGSGTKVGWAAPPASCDLMLRMTGLDRVVDHQPGDLVVVAEAGVRLSALQKQLAQHNQMLALDPPEDGATLGGIVGANASGPRRLRFGTVRDLLIGVTVVLADGTTARSGGKVVKNVAGYDLGKLYTGAHGSLGVVVSTTWRLHPLPPARGAVVVRVADAAQAGRFEALLSRSTLTPTAVELRWDGAAGELVVLFESIAASVDAQSDAAIALLGTGERVDTPPPWFGERPRGGIVLRLAYVPHALPDVLTALPDGSSGTASACTGVAYVSVPSDTDLAALRTTIAPHDGSAVVVEAPDELRDRIDHWGPVPDSFGLMKRVKDQFDPGRRLSPGRLLGGL
ncbi:FAD-binding oxidoreductase [Labedaea rhizosphaerae]|uniref:Glycolate oxidase FAD binding subunit n=1 Tax=Labedaea rhizosphaerae TaxID=598644 RepID=A0A4R6SEY2_LABRH|nr:FAD-binding oxidoreductase [Labedaea rhizosphaerae]TDQ00165.1 glycolate oxidase FAD binding subunit [Labedaea rhizosphaerae]